MKSNCVNAEVLAGPVAFQTSEEFDFELIFDLDCRLPGNAGIVWTN
jgi:hypothetical protein